MTGMVERQERRDVVSARVGANIERGYVATWLRARGERNKSLIYFTLADEIEAGAHIPRNAVSPLPSPTPAIIEEKD